MSQTNLWPVTTPSTAPQPSCPGGCVLAIVGSIKLDGDRTAQEIIERQFEYHRPRWFVSGGAKGIDSMAERTAIRLGVDKTIHWPEKKGWYWYKKRDLLIAKDAECLVRIFSGSATTYGSGFTANEAEKLGARVWRFKVGDGPAPF